MAKYPGKKTAEKAVTPFARMAAERIVSGRVIDACGWWFMRQHNTRAELVELKVCGRATSYRMEAAAEELFGKPVPELTEGDIVKWIGLRDGAPPTDG